MVIAPTAGRVPARRHRECPSGKLSRSEAARPHLCRVCKRVRKSEEVSELANSKSARKRIRVAERKRLRNRPYRTAARTYVKKAEIAIRAGDMDAAAAAVGDAISMLDRVAGKGIIHKNNAARRKSRLMAKFNRLAAAQSA